MQRIPKPQGRMRYSNYRGFVASYDPSAKEKKCVKETLLAQKSEVKFEHPRISFMFHMPIPSGISKKQMTLYESGYLKHEKKPDVDNLIKLYLDCMDGIFMHGDQKVTLGPCIKVYHKNPKTIIWIHETSQNLQPFEIDLAFLDDE